MIYVLRSKKGIVISNLHIRHFNNLDEETQTKAQVLYGEHVASANALIIVGENYNQAIVYGYLIISEHNMTLSPYFEYFRSNVLALEKIDCKDEFYHSKCYKIVDWAFDSSLKTKSNLVEVFEQIALMYAVQNNRIYIWMEYGNQITYFPIAIDENKVLETYGFIWRFSDLFMTMNA